MKKLAFLILLFTLFHFSSQPAVSEVIGMDTQKFQSFWGRLRTTIECYLHRPYVWGSSGLKSFDCSGFVWRVLNESGVPIKRTTARKYYLSLPAIGQNQEYRPGTIVFFNDLKHCGIISNDRKFYHARSSMGLPLIVSNLIGGS